MSLPASSNIIDSGTNSLNNRSQSSTNLSDINNNNVNISKPTYASPSYAQHNPQLVSSSSNATSAASWSCTSYPLVRISAFAQ